MVLSHQALFPNHPMAGNEVRDRIVPDGSAYCPCGAGLADVLRDVLVGADGAGRYFQQGLPHFELKIGALNQ